MEIKRPCLQINRYSIIATITSTKSIWWGLQAVTLKAEIGATVTLTKQMKITRTILLPRMTTNRALFKTNSTCKQAIHSKILKVLAKNRWEGALKAYNNRLRNKDWMNLLRSSHILQRDFKSLSLTSSRKNQLKKRRPSRIHQWLKCSLQSNLRKQVQEIRGNLLFDCRKTKLSNHRNLLLRFMLLKLMGKLISLSL